MLLDEGGGGVGNMQHWDGHAPHHLVCELVRRIRGEDDEIRSSTLKRLCLLVEDCAGLIDASTHAQTVATDNAELIVHDTSVVGAWPHAARADRLMGSDRGGTDQRASSSSLQASAPDAMPCSIWGTINAGS